MIRSMTGFGRAEAVSERRKITVEMKSVNNRYADFNIRMPRKLNFLEGKIRNILKDGIARGKVDIFITSEEYGDAAGSLKFNPDLAAAYIRAMRDMIREHGLAGEVSVSDLVRAPEVFSIGDAETDGEEIWAMLEPVLTEAVRQFNDAREAEGEKLREDILGKLEDMEKVVDGIIEHEPEIMEAYRAKLLAKVSELLADSTVEESRIAAECVLYADRICTDEETVRLKSHIGQMRAELGKTGSIGRKLDFLAQEMNREANTTLSKAGDLITADCGIGLKTTIEKIREQIQNIE